MKNNRLLESQEFYKKTFTNFGGVSSELRQKLESINFERFEDFYNFLNSVVEKETTIKLTKGKTTSFHKPWFNQRLRELWKAKQKFFKLRKKFPLNGYFLTRSVEYSSLLRKESNQEKRNSTLIFTINKRETLVSFGK